MFIAGLSSGAFAQPALNEAKPAAAAEMTTTIKKSDATVEIEGGVVNVSAEKHGRRLTPIAVEIR